MPSPNLTQQLDRALDSGQGILRLAPTWVPRVFSQPGGRMRLALSDLYALGAHRGGIDERWFASTVRADNGPDTPPDEGLSYVVDPAGGRFLLADAIQAVGCQLIGASLMDTYGGWPVFSKFFDNQGAIPFHLHQRPEHARLVGQQPKPEAYYFPIQLNAIRNDFPYSFLGLEPGVTRDDLRRCLERWHVGDNGVLNLSKAYRLEPGTGWLIPPGILHAPGSLCTYEVQWASDVYAIVQSMVDGRVLPWDVVVKDVPPDRRTNLDFILDLVDWDANLNPTFRRDHYLEPIPLPDPGDGASDRWVIYGHVGGQNLFSAKELTVQSGATATLRDGAPNGLLVLQGRGALGPFTAEAPGLIRFGDLTWDEFFVTDEAAHAGFTVINTGREPLVLLRYFGPGAADAVPPVGAHRSI